MQSEKPRQTVTKIRPYDGYQGRPLWERMIGALTMIMQPISNAEFLFRAWTN